jgi:hypothetical protein
MKILIKFINYINKNFTQDYNDKNNFIKGKYLF